MTKSDLADFLERLKAHDPDHDKGKPLRFSDIAKAFPDPQISDGKRYPRVRMATSLGGKGREILEGGRSA